MPRVTPTLLTAAISLAWATGATAQVTKPRNPPSPTDRLPAPAKITAAQEANGHIRVTWNSVSGAVSYKLSRSVPPASGITPVALPTPEDTVYLDPDVKPGNHYYYQVSAVNEAGIGGMNRSAAPVKATDPAANRPPDPPQGVRAVLNGSTAEISWTSMNANDNYQVERASTTGTGTTVSRVARGIPCCRASDRLESYAPGTRILYRVSAVNPMFFTSPPALSNELTIGPGPSTDTGTGQGTPADTTTGQAPSTGTSAPALAAPTNVVAKPYPYMKPTVTWQSAETRARFLVERRVPPAAEWKQIIEVNWRPVLVKCCVAQDPSPPEDAHVVYRVTAVDTVAPESRSPPTLSNEIVNWKIKMDPPVFHDTTFTIGQSGRIFTPDAPLRGIKWVSLEPQIVTVDVELGIIKVLRDGSTYIVATGSTYSGGLQSHVWRVQVDP